MRGCSPISALRYHSLIFDCAFVFRKIGLVHFAIFALVFLGAGPAQAVKDVMLLANIVSYFLSSEKTRIL